MPWQKGIPARPCLVNIRSGNVPDLVYIRLYLPDPSNENHEYRTEDTSGFRSGG